MAESTSDYRDHAGYVVFPRSSADLTDTTRCPACYAPLTAVLCSNCGLDVASPVAIELAHASTDAAEALDERLNLIGRIRFETAHRVAAPVVAADVPVFAPSPEALAAVPAPSAPPVAQPAAPVAPPVPRRQISVQVVLLLVGVALLSIGAIFFLVYAFINFGLVWRSLIIATVTIAAYVGASILNRRRLTATAESVAVLAVILTYLDAFALRANDLLVVGDSPGFAHWGGTLIISAVGFIVWNRFTGLRVASIVGFATVAPGIALLTLGLSEALPNALPPYLALVALSIGCLTYPLAGRISRASGAALPERYTMVITALVAVVLAGVVALFLDRQTSFASTTGLLVVAAAGAAHADLSLRTGLPRGVSSAFAALAAIAASVSFAVAGPVAENAVYFAFVPLLAAVAIALALEAAHRRFRAAPARTSLLVASVAAGSIAAIIAIAPAFEAIGGVFDGIRANAGLWAISGSSTREVRDETYLAVAALAAVVVAAALAWAGQGILRGRTTTIVWAASAVLLLTPPLAGVLWASMGSWLLLGSAGAAALLFLHTTRAVRIAIAVSAAVATALGYATSWASYDIWLLGSLGTLFALLLGWRAVTSSVGRSAVLAVATVVALVAAGAGGWRLQELVGDSASAAVLSALFVNALAVLLLITTTFASRFLSALETRVVYWISLATTVVASGALWLVSAIDAGTIRELVVPGYVSLAVLSAISIAALLLWMAGTATEQFRAERLAASVALAPTLAWFAVALTLALSPTPLAGTLALVATIAVALVAACALGVVRFSPGLNLRGAVDAGVALVTVAALLVAVVERSDLTWLVLLTAAIVALLASVSADGLFASDSPRKHLGWVSLLLAVSALVWLLSTEHVRDVAAYVLPPAGALLLVSAAAWNSARRRGLASPGSPKIALAGLLLALTPLGIAHSAELTGWLVIVAAGSAALLLAGTLVSGSVGAQPYLDAAAIAGALGLMASAYGRAYVLATHEHDTIELTSWLAATFLVLTLAAFGVARQSRSLPVRLVPSQVLLGIPMLVTLVLGLISVGDGPVGVGAAPIVGGVSLVVLFAAIHVVGGILDRAPFTRIMSWISIGCAAVAWLVAASMNALQPLEWATVQIALALLITGGVTLARSPDARSWPWLSPGILVLILPSLLASFVDEPIWRLVGVGIACVAAIVVGALVKLQAPLVLGAVLVLIHGLRTFAPQLVAVYQLTEWWVWAVVGGAIIFFIGFTFEKRKRDFQNTTTKIAALR
ncbi:MAG: SCO7613 C-terminal domain-containing membrane protein [Rhodoglobus sp.]